MKILTYLIFITSVLVPIFFISQAFAPNETENMGEQSYQEYCASCHGNSGKGNGDLAYLVYPKPRDFTSGLFKIRSTPAGVPPTDDDIFKTIHQGLPGTSMPSFKFLRNQEIKSLINIVKDFAQIDNQDVQKITIPDEIPPSEELIDLGRSIYMEVGCNMCHGNTGKGDGSSSGKLKDSKGYSIIPKDFTSGVYLGGGTKRDLYLRFVGGMAGTPMPSYGNLSDLLGRPKKEENRLAWALVHYVKSLESKKFEASIKQPENGKLIATKISRFNRPADFMLESSKLWKNASSYSIPVSRLWQSDNINYQMVDVQAVHNSKYIALKLEWEDHSRDQGTYRVQDFQDGAGIQFSIDSTKGFHGMGSKDHPTDIWYWKAEWQMRVDKKTDSDITLAYVNRVSDSDVDTYPLLMNDITYLSGRDAGNINSESKKISPVENVVATGPQTVTSFPENAQTVMGKGTWDGNKWRIVFVRKLKPASKQKVDFEKVGLIPIAFAIWNGSERDRNGQKMVSTWYELELKN
jgi:mono/diheme cytochrome c family protein